MKKETTVFFIQLVFDFDIIRPAVMSKIHKIVPTSNLKNDILMLRILCEKTTS